MPRHLVAEVTVKQRSLCLLVVCASLTVLMSLSLSISMYLAECHANHMAILEELEDMRLRRSQQFSASSNELRSFRWSQELLELPDTISKDEKMRKAAGRQTTASGSSLQGISQDSSTQTDGGPRPSEFTDFTNGTFPLDEKSPPFAIFYHIYIPHGKDDNDIDKAIKIVDQQLRQVGQSFAASLPDKTLTVFYNTVGLDLLNATIMDDICWKRHKIRCQHVAHYEKAYEEKTLKSVFDFCNAHEDMRVVYMHSKGSYHGSARNHRLRQRMVEAVTSEMCLKPPDESCNLCGLRFSAMRGLFFPGNFWTAKCDYVNRLLSPEDYKAKLTDVVKDAQLMKVRRQLVMKLLPESPATLGLDRYASEFWVGSHPSIIPCDVSKTEDFKYWLKKHRNTGAEFEWSMAPRHKAIMSNRKIRAREDLRLREYNLLAGNIFRWQRLYGEFPESSSWIWRWFPDGDKWHYAVQKYGSKAVEVMTALD